MLEFTLLFSDLMPVPHQQVLIRCDGRYEYGITNAAGQVSIPHVKGRSGRVLVKGHTVYMGELHISRIVLPCTQACLEARS